MRRRLGLTTVGVLGMVSAIGVVGAASIYATPRLLQAKAIPSSSPAADRSQWSPGLRDVIEALEVILHQSQTTTAIVQGRGTIDCPEFITFQLNDETGLGDCNRSEFIALRFSHMLRSITAYAWEPSPTYRSVDAIVGQGQITLDDVIAFTRLPDTKGQVIGIEIDSWAITAVGPSGQINQSSPLDSPGWIQVTSSSRSTDSTEMAIAAIALPPLE